MPVILILIALLAIGHPATAQTDTSYQLLWYQGKKIKPNVLLTVRGDTVRFDPSRKIIKVASKKTAPTMSGFMLTELNKTPLRIQETIRSLSSIPKPALPAYVEQLEITYGSIREQFTPMLTAGLAVPDDAEIGNSGSMKAGKGGGWDPSAPERTWGEAIQELHNHMKQLDAAALFTSTPKPPYASLSYAATCDYSEQSRDIHEKADEFAKKIKGDDDALLIKALSLSHAASRQLEGSELRQVQNEVNKVLTFLNKRIQRKISLIVNTYGDDPEMARSLMIAISTLQFEQESLLPGVPFNQAFVHQLCGSMIRGISEALDKRQYAIALNVSYFLQVERYCRIIGFEIPGHAALREKFFRFNQFRLDMHIAARARGEGGTIETELKGSNWFMAVPNKGSCRLQWILVGPELNTLDMDMIKNKMVAKVNIPYVGSNRWKTTVPTIKVDFYIRWSDGNGQTAGAEALQDSIVVSPFYEKDYNEAWQFPPPMGVTKVTMSSSVLLGSFMDIERLKKEKETDPEERKKRAEQLKASLEKDYGPLMEKYKSTDGKRPAISAEDLRKLHRMQAKTAQMTNSITENLPGRYIFTPAVSSENDPVVIDDKLDGKILFPQNSATEFAWFKLKMEHHPEGKYNTYRAMK